MLLSRRLGLEKKQSDLEQSKELVGRQLLWALFNMFSAPKLHVLSSSTSRSAGNDPKNATDGGTSKRVGLTLKSERSRKRKKKTKKKKE